MRHAIVTDSRGFTLVELLVAMAVMMGMMAAAFSLFVAQDKAYFTQNAIAETQQNTRIALDLISREIRMAGYAPYGGNFGFTSPTVYGVTYQSVTFTMDLDRDGIVDPNETITYQLVDDATDPNNPRGRLVRTQGGVTVTVADYLLRSTDLISGVAAPGLLIEYFDYDPLTGSKTSGDSFVAITLRARTQNEDPNLTDAVSGFNLLGTAADGVCRVRTLTTVVDRRRT
jgi:prepilin-type N-terminal cleavage/methylation domain-containing protein